MWRPRRLLNAVMVPVLFVGLVGCSEPVAEEGFEQVVIDDPSILVHDDGLVGSLASDDNGVDLLRYLGLEPGARHEEFDQDSIIEAVTEVFERGDGDDLYILKQLLVPAAVTVALVNDDVRVTDLPQPDLLVAMDGVLDAGILDSGYEPPDELEPAEVERVLDAGLGSLLAQAIGTDPDVVDWGPAITVLTNPLPTGPVEANNSLPDYYVEFQATVIATLDAAGRLAPSTAADPLPGSRVVLNPSTGQPVVLSDGAAVVSSDFIAHIFYVAKNQYDRRYD